MTDLPKQLLRAKNREGTSAQPLVEASIAHIPQAFQNQGEIQQLNNTLCPSPLSNQLKLQSLWT